jgi:predicted ATP-binding protein involved in virulence
MHIHSIKIQNFRALEDIRVEFDSKVNVIVGPNAAGKTTILEAIRLVKALLAPRTQNEATQVIHSLGMASPHSANQLRSKAIARDDQKPVVIGCHFSLGVSELSALALAVDTIATSMVESQAGQAFAAPGALISFLSSPQGKQMFSVAKEQIQTALTKTLSTKKC